MAKLNKYALNNGLREWYCQMCLRHQVKACDTSVLVQFPKPGQIVYYLVWKDRILKEIEVSEFLNLKLLALRFGPNILEKLFTVLHYAFVKQTKTDIPENIFIVVFFGKRKLFPSIGVLNGSRPIKSLYIHEVVEATELESEQFN